MVGLWSDIWNSCISCEDTWPRLPTSCAYFAIERLPIDIVKPKPKSKACDLVKFLDPEKETLFCFDLLWKDQATIFSLIVLFAFYWKLVFIRFQVDFLKVYRFSFRASKTKKSELDLYTSLGSRPCVEKVAKGNSEVTHYALVVFCVRLL